MGCRNAMHSPYISCRPIRLSAADTTRPSITENTTIILNLALVHHMKNRSPQNAVQLYELARSFLNEKLVDEVCVALIMNNLFGP